jgi:hypothetical protein
MSFSSIFRTTDALAPVAMPRRFSHIPQSRRRHTTLRIAGQLAVREAGTIIWSTPPGHRLYVTQTPALKYWISRQENLLAQSWA